MNNADTFDHGDEIAIIGLAGRFPGARSVDEFWQNLKNGVESISFFTDEELQAAGVDARLLSNPRYVKAKGALKDTEMFDASFFDINPREAELMDPQHRFFLECAWETLENAGYSPESYKDRIGVFAGESLNTYSILNLYSNPELLETMGSYQALLANDRDYLTTRASYKLNLRGPSVNVQTACSSSLVAVHMACQSLLNGECRMALAGGVAIVVPQKAGYIYQESGILSPDGRCRAFDSKAQGCIDGYGVGLVLLKSLEDALADGDHIHAVIKGSAINNDGSLKAGFTAPSVDGQAEVIREALTIARVEADTIGYIEAHGTGTSLGDPIEIAAITQAFRRFTNKKGFCAIGSAKTNIGHLDAAAGIAGLIKTVLALEHQSIPPTLHYEQPNPQIDFGSSPVYVNAKLSEWKAGKTPRRAGVSSFGIGGTNAHVILQQAPRREPSPAGREWHLLTLSAKTGSALDAATSNLVDYLKGQGSRNLADVAYTLQVSRSNFGHRRMVVCRDIEDAVTALEGNDVGRVFSNVAQPASSPIAFMFPGQGMQHVGMGLELYEKESVFRDAVTTCSQLLQPHLGFDIRAALYPDEGQQNDSRLNLDQTALTQPALFVIEYALAMLWRSWGVQPLMMIGHSIGEYVAACLAGVFSLEDALSLVASRGRLMQALPEGAMLAVPLDEAELLPMLGQSLSLAAINGPSRSVVSGPPAAIASLQGHLKERAVDCIRLHTSHAFHSEMMTPILSEFEAEVKRAKLNPPKIPFISNVTGRFISAAEAVDPGYWSRHLRQTVRFEQGMHELLKTSNLRLLEVGPGQSLSSLARRHPSKTKGHVVCSSLSRAEDRQSDLASMLNSLGKLWLSGTEADWPGLHAGERRLRVPLPNYPFERKRFWIDSRKEEQQPVSARAALGKKPDVADWFYTPLWKQSLPPAHRADSAEKQSCLVFSDRCGLALEVIERLERDGHEVISVIPGEQFARGSDGVYTINPRSRNDYGLLLKERGSLDKAASKIIHLWSVTPHQSEAQAADSYDDRQWLGFYSLLFLAQAIGGQKAAQTVDIIAVSNNLQRVAGETALYPEKATLLGPCRVIPQEYQNITCRSVDINLDDLGSAQKRRLLDRLLAELLAGSSDAVVAYRGAERWVQSFEPVRLNAADMTQSLRTNGVYLITGGFGGIGLELAHWLAKSVRARLVMTGRSPIPDRSDWEQLLKTDSGTDGLGRTIRKLQAIEELGGEVMIFNADVTNEEQMQEVIAQANRRFGKINAVIHAAGIAGSGIIQTMEPETSASVLSPKMKGALVLDGLLKDTELDFFALFSSLNSTLGGFAQVDYCAANAFLDAFAHHKTSTSGTPTVSINWDAWQEVGMAVNSTRTRSGRGTKQSSGRPVDHPLLNSCILETADEQAFSTLFSPMTHWVLNEHRIIGNPVIPGTTYLEMARAAFREQSNGSAIEIRDVFFITPLRVPDGEEVEVRTFIQKNGDSFRFSIKSDVGDINRPAGGGQDHAIGNIAYSDVGLPKSHDIDEILKRCNLKRIGAPEQWPDDDGPRWRTMKEAYIGKDEMLALIELPEEYAQDLKDFILHPALLDVATGIPKQYLGDGSYYLPLSYKRLIIAEPLPTRIYSYARYKEYNYSKKETMTFDLILMDEQGRQLVEIQEFTAKRVNDAELRIKEWNGDEERAEPGDSDAAGNKAADALDQGILIQEGIEAFARILSGNLLSQVLVSTQDFQAVMDQAQDLTQAALLKRAAGTDFSMPRSTHPRPEMQSEYVAPRNEMENSLAEIWQSMFGIEKVGVLDNFFEVGGDSVMAIQIIARANQMGIQISPQQLFQHQTIAELAAVADQTQATQYWEGKDDSPAPVTPFQLAILEDGSTALGGYSDAYLIEADSVLDASILRDALRYLIARHDALRLRFERVDAGWQQVEVNFDGEPPLSIKEVLSISEAEQALAIESFASELRARLDPASGSLLQLGLLEFAAREPGHLLIVAHRLAFDGPSLRTLLEDLRMSYDQLSRGETPELPLNPASFTRWARQFNKQEQPPSLEQEISYWISQLEAATDLPESRVDSIEQKAPGCSASLYLTAEETEALRGEVLPAYHVRLSDVLLTALVQTFSRWTGGRSLLVDLETGWREEAVEEADFSKTIGQFAFTVPVLLDLTMALDLESSLKAVKEQLRRIPNRGMGYGMLRYLSDDSEAAGKLRALPQAKVCFRNPGELDGDLPGPFTLKPVRKLDRSAGLPKSASQYLFEIEAFVIANQLHVNWVYRESLYSPATIERLLQDYGQMLRSLISHCVSAGAEVYTPSDFPLAGLDERKLSKLSMLISRTDELEEVK